ncbi:MAG TPA: hypothetical protein VMC80_02050 [Patescibacteria group bacterium]|nr:hypothetical protein [Patescibacteria group bacterium]
MKDKREEIKEGYWGYYNKASVIYSMPDGHYCLLCAIKSEELRDGLKGIKFEAAQITMLDFLNGRNTTGSNRFFGIGLYEKEKLVERAEEKERILSNSHQQA